MRHLFPRHPLQIILLLLLAWMGSVSCTGKRSGECRSDKDCPPGKQCLPSARRCAVVASCTPKTGKACHEGHLYWVDSCGERGKKAEDCGNQGCTIDQCRQVPTDRCGDKTCAPLTENCLLCPQDCACSALEKCDSETATCKPRGDCGNGICNSSEGENCLHCHKDCACRVGEICDSKTATCRSQAGCGDGACDATKENCSTCPQDCPCPAGKICDPGTATCKTQGGCGDGICDATKENCSTCPKDCSCPAGKICDPGTATCKTKSICGDGACNATKENCSSCPKDCPCAAGKICSRGSCIPKCSSSSEVCDDGKDNDCDGYVDCDDKDCANDKACQTSVRCHSNADCSRGQICVSGVCQAGCPSGQTNCSGSCVDLQTNPKHCGACGVFCKSGKCSGGKCLALPGKPCSSDSDCARDEACISKTCLPIK